MSTPADTPGAQLQFRTTWPFDGSRAAKPANQFAVAPGQSGDRSLPDGTVYMMFGHLAPPILLSPEDLAAYMEQTNGVVSIDMVAAIVMPQDRALDMYNAIGRQFGFEPRVPGIAGQETGTA